MPKKQKLSNFAIAHQQAEAARKAKYEEEKAKNDQIRHEFAPRMLELASKALEAVQELIQYDEAACAAAGHSLFVDENRSLEDASMAINVVRVRAQRALNPLNFIGD